jgi:hypothetical protein
MEKYAGTVIYSHAFVNSALDGSDRIESRSGRFNHRKRATGNYLKKKKIVSP